MSMLPQLAAPAPAPPLVYPHAPYQGPPPSEKNIAENIHAATWWRWLRDSCVASCTDNACPAGAHLSYRICIALQSARSVPGTAFKEDYTSMQKNIMQLRGGAGFETPAPPPYT